MLVHWVYNYFILRKAPLVNHIHFIFWKFFPIYAVCELMYLSVMNYSVRF